MKLVSKTLPNLIHTPTEKSNFSIFDVTGLCGRKKKAQGIGKFHQLTFEQIQTSLSQMNI